MDEYEILQIQEQYHNDIMQRLREFDPTINFDESDYISVPEAAKIIHDVSEDYKRLFAEKYSQDDRASDYANGNYRPVHMACEFERELDNIAQDFEAQMQKGALLSPAAMEGSVSFELHKQSVELHRESERAQYECKDLYDKQCNTIESDSISASNEQNDPDQQNAALLTSSPATNIFKM